MSIRNNIDIIKSSFNSMKNAVGVSHLSDLPSALASKYDGNENKLGFYEFNELFIGDSTGSNCIKVVGMVPARKDFVIITHAYGDSKYLKIEYYTHSTGALTDITSIFPPNIKKVMGYSRENYNDFYAFPIINNKLIITLLLDNNKVATCRFNSDGSYTMSCTDMSTNFEHYSNIKALSDRIVFYGGFEYNRDENGKVQKDSSGRSIGTYYNGLHVFTINDNTVSYSANNVGTIIDNDSKSGYLTSSVDFMDNDNQVAFQDYNNLLILHENSTSLLSYFRIESTSHTKVLPNSVFTKGDYLFIVDSSKACGYTSFKSFSYPCYIQSETVIEDNIWFLVYYTSNGTRKYYLYRFNTSDNTFKNGYLGVFRNCSLFKLNTSDRPVLGVACIATSGTSSNFITWVDSDSVTLDHSKCFISNDKVDVYSNFKLLSSTSGYYGKYAFYSTLLEKMFITSYTNADEGENGKSNGVLVADCPLEGSNSYSFSHLYNQGDDGEDITYWGNFIDSPTDDKLFIGSANELKGSSGSGNSRDGLSRGCLVYDKSTNTIVHACLVDDPDNYWGDGNCTFTLIGAMVLIAYGNYLYKYNSIENLLEPQLKLSGEVLLNQKEIPKYYSSYLNDYYYIIEGNNMAYRINFVNDILYAKPLGPLKNVLIDSNYIYSDFELGICHSHLCEIDGTDIKVLSNVYNGRHIGLADSDKIYHYYLSPNLVQCRDENSNMSKHFVLSNYYPNLYADFMDHKGYSIGPESILLWR